jgi:hypothetical protein
MYVVLTVGTAVGSLEIRAPLPRVYDAERRYPPCQDLLLPFSNKSYVFTYATRIK